jgi:DNA polymerase III epsilon subunit-like protein
VIAAKIFERYLRRTPERRLPTPAHTPLERLTFVAIDCESTGLDARRDRLVSFAAVRISPGLVVEPQPLLDVLVDPGIAVPSHASAIHGLTQEALAGAPRFAQAFDAIAHAMEDGVVLGHHVSFDLELLSAEAARAGRRWRAPAAIDTALLRAGFGGHSGHADLEQLLHGEGVVVRGRRHSAAGDALMTADLFVALAHRLRGLGRATFGGAVAHQHGLR